MSILFLLIPILNTAYQICIKLAGSQPEPWLLVAIISEIIAFILWMKILSTHNLSKAFPLTAASYILVLTSGWLLFKEPIMPIQIIGSLLIIAGIWLIGTTSNKNI